MMVPPFMVKVYEDLYAPGVSELLLCIARKNIKSAALAVLLLAHLIGPLRKRGFRAGIASVNKLKANELKDQMSGHRGGVKPRRSEVLADPCTRQSRKPVR